MTEFIQFSAKNTVPFVVETQAFQGVKKIAEKITKDFENVCGVKPEITENINNAKNAVIFATLGNSPIIDKLTSEGKFDTSCLCGKREVYQIKLVNDPFTGTSKALLICGSDKRGTIYGMFALSEYIGVSPLHFWSDVEPNCREQINITNEIETVSKEPSIKYRGFFINDEWPCFGNWTFSRFNGFTAEMYDHVFELILRLKGNYLWPAMWSSSFALDGPGNLNEELADIYGVIIGASHHEPCLRASEEWDKVRGQQSEYGNAWNYYTNKNGLLKYWEDGLKRSGKYEKIITIGMRGEKDSSMLGKESSVKDNIDLLKDIIENQRKLIKKHVNSNLEETPQLLALYKEVEEYFYGNEQEEGLKNWAELEDVICMLCEDNFGFMRTLPTEDIRGRKGGFGMYYHFDYHGGPISYEWMASTPYEKTWEQMCMAYDYGIKDVWIVNVGDLKFNEVPLVYFMELAYDFEKWGTGSPNSINEYTLAFFKKTFPVLSDSVREKMAFVLHGYIKINALRRPESQNAETYHPCHYLETDRMLLFAGEIDKTNEEIYSSLSEKEKAAYYSMIYYPAKASLNLLRMNLYAAKNIHYARQGKKIANKFSDLVTKCIDKDRILAEEFSAFKSGKWKGMELEQHIGFVRWNEDNCRYPLRVQVEPAYKPRLVVSRKDREEIYFKTYGNPMMIYVDDFLYYGNDEVILEVANDGIGCIDYTIETNVMCDWLEISPMQGSVESQMEIVLRCNRDKLSEQIKTVCLIIKDNETKVAVEVKAKASKIDNLPPMTFLENMGIIAMEANHYHEKKDVPCGSFTELKNYGRSGQGMKVYPTVSSFENTTERPILTYRFFIENPGDYTAEVWMTPSNPVKNKQPLRFMFGERMIDAVPADFQAGNAWDRRWCNGVLDNIRISKVQVSLEQGIQEISIGAVDAGLVLERILIYKKGKPPLSSYLGPPESFYIHK
ncbi:MAG: glycosyl hydrolase 115 family protein [Treponema sp.]|nr:glycosyl hydrolase 115 family protein [Treponema sp.]